ncbi:hypothetical protein [Lactiplantibacillus herbarum]|uniref:hypothetical protein n=1 Tax=Lactiplantibacillus herbarum TaxID=1670446 RepID=UPI00064E8F5B|nr:hypothetical protein [Lactiplantibacillus herbarum]
MDYFQQKINQWSDWQVLSQNAEAFEPLIKQIYLSENKPFKTPEVEADPLTAVFTVGTTQIAIFPPSNVLPETREYYQTERFSLTRMSRLQLGAPKLLHAGFIFDAYQFYYVIYQPLQGVSLTNFILTAEPLAKSTLGRQIGTLLNQLNGEVATFSQIAEPAADWNVFGSEFVTARTAWLAAHPTTPNCFIHGNLIGENFIVTSGQLGVRHFSTAHQGFRQAELVPIILKAFDNEPDLLAGFKDTYQTASLADDLLVGLLVRADGPDQIRALLGGQAVDWETLRERLGQLLGD